MWWEGWQRWLKREGNACSGGRTDSGCGLGLLPWVCYSPACQTVPFRLTGAEMKMRAVLETFLMILLRWWEEETVIVWHEMVSPVLPWWHIGSNFYSQAVWRLNVSVFWLSCFLKVSDIFWVWYFCWHCLEDRSVSVSGDFCVVHSLKHPREKKPTGHAAEQTCRSIHQVYSS